MTARRWMIRTGVGLAAALAVGVAVVAARATTVRVSPPEGPLLAVPTAKHAIPFPHDAFGRVLRAVVDDRGRVDYRALRSDRTELERYMVALATTSPDAEPAAFPTRRDQLAYWINAYNAAVLYGVTERPGLASVYDVKYQFFGFTRYDLGGTGVSLHTLENDIIRARYDEPRIHFALNCASAGCPELPTEPFAPDGLDAQLDREARAFCADPGNVRLEPDGAVAVSQIFEWYAEDFSRGPIVFCRNHGREDLPLDAQVRFIPYDWSLNAQAD